MTARLPLVLANDGSIEQLQLGDTLAMPPHGVSNNDKTIRACVPTTIRKMFVSAGLSANVGTPVYIATCNALPATANSQYTSNVAGLAIEPASPWQEVEIQTEGVVTTQEDIWALTTNEQGGLTPGNFYYLSLTPGKLTANAPTANNSYVTPIGFALSSTELMLRIGAPREA